MGRLYEAQIVDSVEIFTCRQCGAPLCDSGDVVSKGFHGKTGQAYLVSRCLNSYFGPQEQKQLMTGVHIVRDVYCRLCHALLGWTYDYAVEERERYKTCKYVLECALFSRRYQPHALPHSGGGERGGN
jgi:hypothetical protein